MQLRLIQRCRGPGLGAAGAVRLVALLAVLWSPAGSRAEVETPRTVLLAQAEDAEADESAIAAEEAAEPSEEEPEATGSDESDVPPPGVEVIRVRGRGIGAIETDIPSSITQFDAATIEALGAQDISDLSRVTPNVNIVQPGSTQATFFVRGIGLSDFSSNAAGAVTIFQDDVAINAPAIQTGQLYDVEGVDIVRGPQGTGPFRNASAGAIRVRSRRPTGNYGAQLRSSIGRYDTKGDKGAKNAVIQDYEGAIEMPIAADALSSRFAFRLRDAEPYKTNGCGDAIPFDQRLTRPTNNEIRRGITEDSRDICGERAPYMWPGGARSRVPEGLPKAVNDEHNWAARGTLRLQPPDTEMDFFLNAHGSRLDQDSTLGQALGTRGFLPGLPRVYGSENFAGYVDADLLEEFEETCVRDAAMGCSNPFAGFQHAKTIRTRPLDRRPYRGDYNRVGQTTRDAWGGFASGEAKPFGETTLFALASYDQYERFQETDTDFSPDRLFELTEGDEAWQMYHELRLSGELESEPIEWELGGFYLGEELDTDGTIVLLSGPNQESFVRRIYSQSIESFGVWGNFGWDFADDFTLEGGVRFNYESKVFQFRRISRVLVPREDFIQQDADWQTPTGQIILTYHLDEEKSAYAKYARGFKAGHFNALATQNFDSPPADEEYNDSWETGLRGAWLDRRVSLGTAFFYYRYENYQVFLFTDSAAIGAPPVLEILNAKQAENFGIEVEGTFLPLRGWAPRLLEDLRVSGNFSWLHGEYLDFGVTRFFSQGGNTFPSRVSYAGQRLQNGPDYKASGTAEWTLGLGRWGYLIPRYDINWSDDVFFDPNEGHGSNDPTDPGVPQLPDYAIGQKQYFLHNVRLAYRTPTGNVEVAGWIRNVEDQVYKNFAFDASRFTGETINFPGEPRTIGVDVSFTF